MTVESHERDERMMARALRLAWRGAGRTRPNPPVGAVVVKDDAVVGEGRHRRAGSPHAEVHALQAAGEHAENACLYVTLEPCSTHGRTPPCTDLVVRSGIRRAVVAVRDPNPRHAGRGIRILRNAGIEVIQGVGREEAKRLLAPFAKWVTTGRPFVTLKMAMTLDGRIADRGGRSKWITGPSARASVQELRRRADVVMVGINTILADDSSLLVRKGRGRQTGFRVVVDSKGRIPLSARVLNDGCAGRTIVATTRQCPVAKCEAIRDTGADVRVLRQASGRVSLSALLQRLGREGMLQVLCEGGGELAAALVARGCVDEYVFYVAPKLLGADGAPVVANLGVTLRDAPELKFCSCERIGDDFILSAVPAGR